MTEDSPLNGPCIRIRKLDELHRQGDANRPALNSDTIAANPITAHPLVRVCPFTKNRGMLFSQHIMTHIEGLSVTKSRKLVDDLADHATSTRFQYRHKWADDGLLIWDNLSVLHRATELDAEKDLRLLYRAIISHINRPQYEPNEEVRHLK